MTSAELVAQAAIGEGKFAQAFPLFGPERRGAPVTAFLRVDDKPIRLREQVYEPDIVVVLDPTVMNITKVDEGLKQEGCLVINTNRDSDSIKSEYKFTQKMALVDATDIAMETLGLAITNTVMLGALVKATGVIAPDSINAPLNKRFSGKLAEKNKAAFDRAFAEAKMEG